MKNGSSVSFAFGVAVKYIRKTVFAVLTAVLVTGVLAGDASAAGPGDVPVPMSGQWFLSYIVGENGGEDVNKFYVHRGYLNFKPKFSEKVSARITPDITQDSTGDIKVRLKYLYMQFNLPGNEFFTKPFVEFGLVHRTWLDFEEHIDYYRMQGHMFLERNHLFNSADFGFTFVTLFGGEVDKTYQKEVSKKYPGRWGSMAFGMYNGGGYHAKEVNTSKCFETRLTLRPLPDSVPGLQLSYFGVLGKGNTVEEPDWTVNTLFASYESKRFVGTGTYYNGEGNSKGKFIDANGRALPQAGYSLFGEFKFPNSNFALIGRYDTFDHDTDVDENNVTRKIVGLAYKFGSHKALLDYDFAEEDGHAESLNKLLKFTIEVYW